MGDKLNYEEIGNTVAEWLKRQRNKPGKEKPRLTPYEVAARLLRLATIPQGLFLATEHSPSVQKTVDGWTFRKMPKHSRRGVERTQATPVEVALCAYDAVARRVRSRSHERIKLCLATGHTLIVKPV